MGNSVLTKLYDKYIGHVPEGNILKMTKDEKNAFITETGQNIIRQIIKRFKDEGLYKAEIERNTDPI